RTRSEANIDVDTRCAGAAGAQRASNPADKENGRRGARIAVADTGRNVLDDWSSFDSTRATAQSDGADGALHGAQRATVLRAAQLQHVVPVVLGHGYDRARLGAHDVLA